MPTNERLVLCGGMSGPRKPGTVSLSLRRHGRSGNVRLKIPDISKRLVANIPDTLVDLLEIACYIYAADSAIRRGGPVDEKMGRRWRRKLRFVIPVRRLDLWSSIPVTSALLETLSFLSEDEYEIEFRSLSEIPAVDTYFEFPIEKATSFTPDEVILFSGGLDSLAGTVERMATHGTKVALVSHRSSPKITSVQKYLADQLRSRFGADRVLHVPVWVTLEGSLSNELMHRTRSFLFMALGAVTARLFGRDRIIIFENGVVSLNMPPVAQVVGARATRTTHPQVLAGFRRLLGNVLCKPFDVESPFMWLTKAEIVQRIADNGFSDLIRHTRSCTRVHDMTVMHPHCGRCSQCVDRRFAIIAANQESEDPPEAYGVELFQGKRPQGPDQEMALAYVRSASNVNQMTDIAFFAHYGETSRVVGFFQEPADAVASRIFDLYRRHAEIVCRVFDEAIRLHAPKLREGSLPANSLLSLVVSQREGGSPYPLPSGVLALPATLGREIRIAIDTSRKRVVFDRWGEVTGVIASLIIALAEPFSQALRDELAPEHYPYPATSILLSRTKCRYGDTLRRRIKQSRDKVAALAMEAGGSPLSSDAIIENLQWHGYRLNPDRIRIVMLSELSNR